MPDAGALRDRVAFQERGLDGNGDRLGEYADSFQRAAAILRLRGGEEVMAGRLAGKKPTLITVRLDSSTRDITTDWRVRNTRTGETFEIKDVALTKDRAFLDVLAEAS